MLKEIAKVLLYTATALCSGKNRVSALNALEIALIGTNTLPLRIMGDTSISRVRPLTITLIGDSACDLVKGKTNQSIGRTKTICAVREKIILFDMNSASSLS